MKFQLIAVKYTGLKFTKGAFNPKPKALEEGGALQNLYLQILSNTSSFGVHPPSTSSLGFGLKTLLVKFKLVYSTAIN